MNAPHSRRRFLAFAATLVATRRLGAQAPDSGAVPSDADRLRQPWTVGANRDTVASFDNDPVIIAIERRLKCTCGCTLDIYTCRTTDFTCTYSPQLHQEVVALYQDGKTPEEIVAHFVARDGEAVLMAPEAAGFNLAGYIVPGLVVATAGLGLAAYLARRREVAAAPAGGATIADRGLDAPAPPEGEAAERLRRALDDVEA